MIFRNYHFRINSNLWKKCAKKLRFSTEVRNCIKLQNKGPQLWSVKENATLFLKASLKKVALIISNRNFHFAFFSMIQLNRNGHRSVLERANETKYLARLLSRGLFHSAFLLHEKVCDIFLEKIISNQNERLNLIEFSHLAISYIQSIMTAFQQFRDKINSEWKNY